jgi:hypothetical protein
MVLLGLASICLLLSPALRVFVHLTWLVAWLSCLPCRIWCKIIIIIIDCVFVWLQYIVDTVKSCIVRYVWLHVVYMICFALFFCAHLAWLVA